MYVAGSLEDKSVEDDEVEDDTKNDNIEDNKNNDAEIKSTVLGTEALLDSMIPGQSKSKIYKFNCQKPDIALFNFALRDKVLEEKKNHKVIILKMLKTGTAHCLSYIYYQDLIPYNFIIYKDIGYFIDFTHTLSLTEGTTITYSHDTGTMPYISIRILKAMMALESSGTSTNILDQNTYLNGMNHTESNQGNTGIDVFEYWPSNDLKSVFYIVLPIAKL
ncbi:hypothetical protein EDD22DRAFT_844909 [Suillus occidentalis]|nr:hypothetical protein EDD22DRAFT_844909 [Suillus occidentalis]